MTLDDALEGKAKSWRNFCITTDPGRTIHAATLVAGATSQDFMTYYRYIRGQLFVRAGLQYENPGELTKKRWENIKIPGNLKFQDDLDEALETIITVYHQLVRHGVIIPGFAQDERRLVMDLGMKVERGTDFRTWFYGGDARQEIVTVSMWIARAQRYKSLLAHRKKELMLEVTEYGSRGGEADGEDADGGVDESTNDADWEETIGRLNDLRQARGGLRKSGSRPGARNERDKQTVLAEVPHCPDCKGRHRVKPCPNVYAKKDGFDPQKAEQSGTRCNYRDPVHTELTCSGRGHLAKHH